MLIWNGYTIEEVNDEAGAAMIKSGTAVEVGPFDGFRQFPTKEEMAAAAGKQGGNEYATKDMTAKKKMGRPAKGAE